MEEIMLWFSQWHPGLLLAGGSIVVLLASIGIWELSVRSHFKKIIRYTMEAPGKEVRPVGPFILKLHVRWIERLAKKKQIPIMEIFDFRTVWLQKFKTQKRRKDLFRLIEFYPDFALFPCFEVCLKHKKRGKDFKKMLEDLSAEEIFFLLKKLGKSCGGVDFDASAGKILLSGHIDSFLELSGDSDWTVRDFAINILLSDDDPRSHRILWDSLSDSHSHVRAAVARGFNPPEEERKRLFEIVYELFLNDPSLAVRKAAKKRLTADFSDLYTLNPETLKGVNVFHVLDLLESSSKEDENLAMFYLDDPDLEICLTSARFLQESGALERIFLSVDFGDRVHMESTQKRLEKAASVNVLGFLTALKNTGNPAALAIAASLLQKKGDRSLIAALALKVFTLMSAGKPSVELLELYQKTLRCINTRGNIDSAVIVRDELQKRKKNEDLRSLIWENLPMSFESLFIADMIQFLKEGTIVPKESFFAAMNNFSKDICLPPLLDLLKSGKETPLSVRQDILMILGELKSPSLIQTLLEALPLLPNAQIPELCTHISALNEKEFLLRSGVLIRSVDSGIRRALILGLTPAGKKEFLKEIREALSDADPDVRLAAFTSLSSFDESKVLNTNAIKLLRDPVDRVRIGVAEALGRVSSQATVDELTNVITSKDEVVSVRSAGIVGLGLSSLDTSTDALLEGAEQWLSVDESLKETFVTALGQKTEKRQIKYTIEKFKDANSQMRDLIASSFTYMGPAGEEVLMDLLNEDIASLKPIICQALEESGVVDIFIRALVHKDPSVRKDAAVKLVKIGTTKAFRGIVQAAKDPSSEIRILVTKALESLNTPAGTDILKELENDPDKRVRRYTSWAMERIHAKSLE